VQRCADCGRVGLRTQIRSNSWIRGPTANGFFLIQRSRCCDHNEYSVKILHAVRSAITAIAELLVSRCDVSCKTSSSRTASCTTNLQRINNKLEKWSLVYHNQISEKKTRWNYQWLDIDGQQLPTHNLHDNCTYNRLSCSHRSENTCRVSCTHPRLQYNVTNQCQLLSLLIDSKLISVHSIKVTERSALMYSHWWTPFHSYGLSLAIWDHTVLPATWHNWIWVHPKSLLLALCHLVSLTVSTPLRIVNRCWSCSCKWWYIHV